MKTIVYLENGAIEQTARADEWVQKGVARYATKEERESYECLFSQDDERIISFHPRYDHR